MKNQKGFTLVEIVIYIGMLGIILSNFVLFGININNIRKKTTIINNVQENNRSIINLLNDTVRRSAGVIIPAKSQISTSSLALNMTGTSQATTTFSLIGNDLYMIVGSQSPIKLNHNAVLDSIYLINTAGVDDRDHLIINITSRNISDDSIDFTYSQTVEAAISVRR